MYQFISRKKRSIVEVESSNYRVLFDVQAAHVIHPATRSCARRSRTTYQQPTIGYRSKDATNLRQPVTDQATRHLVTKLLNATDVRPVQILKLQRCTVADVRERQRLLTFTGGDYFRVNFQRAPNTSTLLWQRFQNREWINRVKAFADGGRFAG
jgi:hypothetical protein